MYVKSGYKVSEVGVIPEEWDVKKLGELFEITSSKRVFQEDWRNSGVPFYRTRELVLLSKNGKVDNELFIDETMYHDYTSRYGGIQKDDLLVSGVGTLGIVYVVKENDKFYFKDGNIIWFKSKKTSVSNYIKYQFQGSTVIDQIKDNSTGTTVGTYTIINAKDTIIPFPPLPEQQKIAEILSTVDEQISETEALIEHTKTLKQGMMQRLLTKGIGHTEFKETEIGRIPVEWDVVPFSSVVYFQEGPGLRNWQYAETGMPFLNIRCLHNGSIDRSKIQFISMDEFQTKYQHFGLNPGDIVVSSSGTLGKKATVAFEDLPIMLNTSIIRLRSVDINRLEMGFLNYFVESDFYQKAVTLESVGSAQANYGPYHLNRIKILLPCITEQGKIASILTTIDNQIANNQNKLDALTRLKSGLMQQLLTGRIRVEV